MSKYFYKGRHRAPTNNGKRIATVVGGSVLLTGAGMAPADAATMPDNIRNAIIACESGNKNINNSTFPTSSASGYYQIINSTWARYGGQRYASRAIGASRAEQNLVADAIYTANGLRDWDASKRCWSKRLNVEAPAQVIRVTPKPRPTNPTKKVVRSVVVKRGDTLSKIAAANNIPSWRTIYAANRGSIQNPNLIFPGQRFTLSK